ncbi:MAG TPA: RimK family alpha-L-glutamate ligase [Acetomicrobium flavidum]|uniref:ATP-grasp domain-containing protein n=1 Tax=Acetomicrobium TaxID=49894 RepID=UPI0026EECF3E|nr:RimK family alpha-L-glutamate ligase [Acetomicrobium mobile]HOP88257.1 RimK family alpha-L-glutamate ligase [Acetomicrobium flavidum]HPP14547.1 RimK family alpha-L-glutamate ligase [Acetomicrobium flavidum]
MKATILGAANAWHVEVLIKAFVERNVSVNVLRTRDLKALINDDLISVNEADLGDVILVRSLPGGSLEQVIFRVDLLHVLEEVKGARVINSPDALEKTVDKMYATALLSKAGLRVPETCVTERYDDAMAAFAELGGDVVVKPVFGSEGRGMTRVSDPETAHRVFMALNQYRYVYYLQRFIPHGNRDIRTFVVNGSVIAAMERLSYDWRCNVALGAQASLLVPDENLIDLSLKAADAVGAFYAGVDILPSEEGELYLLEVNGIPGWRGLQQVAKPDIASTIVEALLGLNP